jgi:6-oxo-cyclohex-1-ene-carbonyl-CoA hydrolase
MSMDLDDLRLAPFPEGLGVQMDRRPVPGHDGLFSVWLTLDNPTALNAYTHDMLRALVLGIGEADQDPAVVTLVLTGAGTKAFCTGGDVAHYAASFAGRPGLMARYMRLYGSVITALLQCAKPTINRVNGARVGGGQELGLACDFSISSDLALYAQGGLKLGSAQEAGLTDFLPLAVGSEAAMNGCTVDGPWSAYKALRLGLLTDVVPVLRVDGTVWRNPLVETDAWLSEGRIVYGEGKKGEELAAGKALLRAGQVDLTALDERVDQQTCSLVGLMPQTTEKALLSLRQHKLDRWMANKEANRMWMAAQTTSEAGLGFKKFAQGDKRDRFIDHAELRRALAGGAAWSDALVDQLLG